MHQSFLHYVWVNPPPTSDRYLYVLHGILGTGQNFRSLARRLVEAHPEWGIVLVDLRMHGRSQGLLGPHTLQASVDDLRRLESRLPSPPSAVLGHSFGGKVAAMYALDREAREAPPLSKLWILDSPLGAGTETSNTSSAMGVIELLERTPSVFDSRDAFVTTLRSSGLSGGLAKWLAMNLRRTDDGFAFGLDLKAVRSLLEDYFRTDLWPLLEGSHTPTQLVLGEHSDVWSDAQKEHAQALADSCAHLQLSVVEGAGHWLHVDNPEGTLATLLKTFPPS